ncbi:MAG: hypothetical protein ACYTXT_41280 [Nostoc sp.]
MMTRPYRCDQKAFGEVSAMGHCDCASTPSHSHRHTVFTTISLPLVNWMNFARCHKIHSTIFVLLIATVVVPGNHHAMLNF